MKNLFKLTLSLLLLLSIFSCKKQNAEATIEGSWEIRESKGGYRLASSSDKDTYSAGNGTIIKFSGTTYEKYAQGKLVDNGTFTIEKEKQQINDKESNYNITFVSVNPALFQATIKQSMNLSSKTLILFFGQIAADGTETLYVKL